MVVTGYQGGCPQRSCRRPDKNLLHLGLPTAVSWIDVYARATCQPREVLVPLSMEPMGHVVKQLVPSCVTVQRCGGCCPDDGLECVPTGQHQVRMQVWGLWVRHVHGTVMPWGLGQPRDRHAGGGRLWPFFLCLCTAPPHCLFLVLLSTDPHDPVPEQSAGGDVLGRTQPM